MIPGPISNFGERATLRIGTQASYQVSQALTVFGGVNYVNTTYSGGAADSPTESW